MCLPVFAGWEKGNEWTLQSEIGTYKLSISFDITYVMLFVCFFFC